MSTIETKLTYSPTTQERDAELNNDRLLSYLQERSKSFPLLNEGRKLTIVGRLGETGVVVFSKGAFAAAVRPPNFIPQKVDVENGIVEFGGQPSEKMVEFSLEIPLGQEKAAQVASMVLIDLRMGFEPQLVSMTNSGLAAVGTEPEAWLVDPENGNLVPISVGELQAGLYEKKLPPIFDPGKFLRERARYTLSRIEEYPNLYILDTSVLPTSHPSEPKINTGHDLGPYVFAIQNLLRNYAFNGSDRLAESVFEQVLKAREINSHDELKNQTGNMAYWVMAASHASVGLPHLREKAYEFFVPAEIAIAVSDIFNSDLATVAEFLMFSTPMIYGVGPITINNQEIWPRDYRTILRYLMDTTNPAPFIGNYQEMVNRITKGIVSGLTHTADRSSYITSVNGQEYAVMHGRVRNRICSPKPEEQTGRVEYTGCSASPSYLDELARNCFLQIMAVAALEAVENIKTPMEYWGDRYPHLASWENQKRLAQLASLYGFNQPEIKQLIDESVMFIQEMIEKYPSLEQIGKIAISRIQNLLKPPADSLNDYVQNPQGPISEVIQREIRRGIDPVELARRIHEFQRQLSIKILEGRRLYYDYDR